MALLFISTIDQLTLPSCNIAEGLYRYTQDLLSMDRHLAYGPGQLVTHPCPPPRVGSAPLVKTWTHYLESHPDKKFTAYLFEIFTKGFHVGYNYTLMGNLCPSLKNHRSEPVGGLGLHKARVYIGLGQRPLSADGSPKSSLQPNWHHSKTTSAGIWRLIVDLPFPDSHSVNDGKSSDMCSIRYTGINNAVKLIHVRHLGQGALLAKLDLKSAYRMVPVHAEDQWLLGMSWKGQVYVDTCLPFGLRSAPKIFSAVADGLSWAMHYQGVEYLLHYLDDFLVLGLPGSVVRSNARYIHKKLHRVRVPSGSREG